MSNMVKKSAFCMMGGIILDCGGSRLGKLIEQEEAGGSGIYWKDF